MNPIFYSRYYLILCEETLEISMKVISSLISVEVVLYQKGIKMEGQEKILA